MNFKIFQVKRSLVGTHTHNFSDLRQMGIKVELTNYDSLYEGESELTDHFGVLEYLFEIFNLNHPIGFNGRSMSVSDIVQLDDKYYFCDSMSWQEITV